MTAYYAITKNKNYENQIQIWYKVYDIVLNEKYIFVGFGKNELEIIIPALSGIWENVPLFKLLQNI